MTVLTACAPAVFVRQQLADRRRWPDPLRARHDDAGVSGRSRRSARGSPRTADTTTMAGLVGRLGMAHRDDGLDAGLADLGERAWPSATASAHTGHASQIGIEIDAGDRCDRRACAAPRRPPASRCDSVDVIASVAAAIKFVVAVCVSIGRCPPRSFASSFNPSRISCARLGAFAGAALAAAMAAAACG